MKIYIIDDDPLSIFVTKTKLAQADPTLDIKTFLSAPAALETLNTVSEEDIPNIILLDLSMPVMDGWGFLEAITPFYSRLDRKTSIYVLTSSIDAADIDNSMEHAYVTGFIHKPIQNEDIQVILTKYTPVN